MHNNVFQKIKTIIDSNFEGKSVIKCRQTIFSDIPGSCIQDNMFFIIAQKNRVIKVKSKNVTELLSEFYKTLETKSSEDFPILTNLEVNALLEKHGFTYSYSKFVEAVNVALKDKIIGGYIFGFTKEGNCIPMKKMWTNTAASSEIVVKRNRVFVKIHKDDLMDESITSKYKEENGFYTISYNDYTKITKSLNLKSEYENIYKISYKNGVEEFILNITSSFKKKEKDGEITITSIPFQK